MTEICDGRGRLMVAEPDMSARMPTTRMSLLDALESGDDATRAAARDRLAMLYLPPIRASLHRRRHRWGMSEADVDDVAQSFYTRKILEQDLFGKFEQTRGRLRSLILTSLHRFLVDWYRQRARQEIGIADHSELDALATARDVAAELDDVFDSQWYLHLVRLALRETREHYEQSRNPAYWDAYERCILLPEIRHVSSPDRSELARELDLRDAQHVSVAVHRVRQRATETLLELLGETTRDRSDRDEEYADLCRRLFGQVLFLSGRHERPAAAHAYASDG